MNALGVVAGVVAALTWLPLLVLAGAGVERWHAASSSAAVSVERRATVCVVAGWGTVVFGAIAVTGPYLAGQLLPRHPAGSFAQQLTHAVAIAARVDQPIAGMLLLVFMIAALSGGVPATALGATDCFGGLTAKDLKALRDGTLDPTYRAAGDTDGDGGMGRGER